MPKAQLKSVTILEHTPANCDAREVLARVGDKWSVYVIDVLGNAGSYFPRTSLQLISHYKTSPDAPPALARGHALHDALVSCPPSPRSRLAC